MSTAIPSGLYRTTAAYPLAPDDIPASALVYVGDSKEGGGRFVVRPGNNRNNRWYWNAPTTPLTDPLWERTLVRLPAEGFYTLPHELRFGDSGQGRWLENAIVQLGFDREGQGILFVGERRDGEETNALYFSEKGMRIDDDLMKQLRWAPILPVSPRLDA